MAVQMEDESSMFKNKTILITGGTGSFGRCLARNLLTKHEPSKVIIFSRDEWKQWEMKNSDPVFKSPNIRYFLGDVRDKDRLMRAFREVDLVVHAAALKQVPAAEYDPSEFVKTNVLGAMNIIDAAIDSDVDKVIALSTDKAVNPINLYGATKLCSDKLFVAGNNYVGSRGFPHFAVVRYGNVLGSRGSIIPLWRSMVEEGAQSIPITDMRMTRFWITLEQAVEFVISCFQRMMGGEIFIPKIPSMKLEDLAEAVAPGVGRHVCGIREGEKLHELMINLDDARHSYEFDDYYVIAPEVSGPNFGFQVSELEKRQGKKLEENFVYSSDKNSLWLGVKELRQVLRSAKIMEEIAE